MNARTLKALRGSIRKWQKIVDGTGVDKGCRNCPLCALFYKNYCVGCPVFIKSEMEHCENTPYPLFTAACTAKEESKFARAELNFLKSLLPKGKNK